MYEFEGDPDELVAAYDRLMEFVPSDGLPFHACVRRDGGIVIYDCCPDRDVFRGFSSSDGLLDAMRDAGLPTATVTELGDVHAARSRDQFITE